MTSKFAATALRRTQAPADAGPLEISFADAAGTTTTITVTAELARSLAGVLNDYADAASQSGIQPTKLPQSFSVGAGRHDSVVLIRFEQDAPYALTLAKALLNESKSVATRPKALLQ